MKKILLVFAIFITGCASIDRSGMSSIEPLRTEPDAIVYRFKAGADAIYTLDSPAAEEVRIEWLRYRLQENGQDPQNFQILKREPIVVTNGLFGTVYNIFYEVRVPKKSP